MKRSSLHTDRIGYLSSDIWQIPFKDFEQILHKANRYSSLGAEKMALEGRKGGMFKALSHGLMAFIHHYVIKLGVLDGWAGFVIAFGNFEGTFYNTPNSMKRCRTSARRDQSIFDMTTGSERTSL